MIPTQELNEILATLGGDPAKEVGRYFKSDPMPSYNFRVYLLTHCFGFSKITNIVETAETETLQEGGVNDRVYTLKKPATQEKTLVFERGALLNLVTYEPLLHFQVGERLASNLLIFVMDRDGAVGRIFEVTGTVVKKLSYSALDSMSNQTLIETFEIAYETLESLSSPL